MLAVPDAVAVGARVVVAAVEGVLLVALPPMLALRHPTILILILLIIRLVGRSVVGGVAELVVVVVVVVGRAAHLQRLPLGTLRV